jgi:hypothetical protein
MLIVYGILVLYVSGFAAEMWASWMRYRAIVKDCDDTMYAEMMTRIKSARYVVVWRRSEWTLPREK